MSWVKDKEQLQAAAKSADAAAILVTKDSWFWKMLGGILVAISVGAMKYSKFMERFATTIGPVQGYPRGWPSSSVEAVCVHEGEHSKQAVVCGIVTWLALCVLFGLLAGFNHAWWGGLILGASLAIFTCFPFWWRPPRIFMAFLGLPLMFLIYGLLPIPAGFAYFRYRMELAADQRKWEYMLAHGASDGAIRRRAEGFAKTISSGAYLWSVPQAMAVKGFLAAAEETIKEYKEG